ncbi:hypothetical protein [Flaviaesturariibacter aridisoli]|uniref:Uncharacterized protein n=1 Tax=Flaviaesturariibacter aridisoli TaxID=2545761 RepID=A0A4R4DZU1_9BACT|nr:hypothetical protein [Flaviaesturariibacter aridisoli]TCZ70153.1 hypothetical protein E0486_11380 [Flaviaesturariibacter aridisoli]
MSTYFFRTNLHGIGNILAIKQQLDQWEQRGEIDHWHIDVNNAEAPLEIVTQQLTPELVKHRIRELGVDVEFTTPPDSADRGSDRSRPPGRP